MQVDGTSFEDNFPPEQFAHRGFVGDVERMKYLSAWNAALEAAAKNLEAFKALQADLQPSMNDRGRELQQAMMMTQQDCANAVRGLKVHL